MSLRNPISFITAAIFITLQGTTPGSTFQNTPPVILLAPAEARLLPADYTYTIGNFTIEALDAIVELNDNPGIADELQHFRSMKSPHLEIRSRSGNERYIFTDAVIGEFDGSRISSIAADELQFVGHDEFALFDVRITGLDLDASLSPGRTIIEKLSARGLSASGTVPISTGDVEIANLRYSLQPTSSRAPLRQSIVADLFRIEDLDVVKSVKTIQSGEEPFHLKINSIETSTRQAGPDHEIADTKITGITLARKETGETLSVSNVQLTGVPVSGPYTETTRIAVGPSRFSTEPSTVRLASAVATIDPDENITFDIHQLSVPLDNLVSGNRMLDRFDFEDLTFSLTGTSTPDTGSGKSSGHIRLSENNLGSATLTVDTRSGRDENGQRRTGIERIELVLSDRNAVSIAARLSGQDHESWKDSNKALASLLIPRVANLFHSTNNLSAAFTDFLDGGRTLVLAISPTPDKPLTLQGLNAARINPGLIPGLFKSITIEAFTN